MRQKTSQHDRSRREGLRLVLLRIVVLVTIVLAVNYVTWRWLESVNWSAWWIGVPLVLAETYSVIDVSLYGMTMWRSRRRIASPPPPPPQAAVDCFITTYDEPVDLVVRTARAARDIEYPHRTWILDDGDRPALQHAARRLGIGYITRGPEWRNKPRHAKAGNLNNAILQTDGEFILVLDADMIPRPQILHRLLGFFEDEKVALVQTPQIFSNVPQGDPLGSQAPLFYGPIQEGKDGWNAAFFCGSNAVLRRDALMQLGIVGYVTQTEKRVLDGLKDASAIVQRARRRVTDESQRAVLEETSEAIRDALREINRSDPLAQVTYQLERRVAAAANRVVASDFEKMAADLATLGLEEDQRGAFDAGLATAAARFSESDLSPANALEAVQATLSAIDIGRADEAIPILPLATNTVTEDMATSMRLHAQGWRTVFHNELLADGLAPEDLDTMLTQRLRWAQGTMQVFFGENPLFEKGLTIPQRLMYLSTMWSYLSGFATLVYLTAPIVFLTLGILPVSSLSAEFFWHFIPFLVANQVLFLVSAHGLPTWRGQQYTLALFPVWIKACTSAMANVWRGVPLKFAVTPKARVLPHGVSLRRIPWQIVAVVLLAIAIVVGVIRLIVFRDEPIGTAVNLVWVAYDFVAFGVLIGAVRYRGYPREQE